MSVASPPTTSHLDRFAVDADPDLERDIGGYVVRLYYTPSLEHPERAIVEIHAGNVLLDVVDVPASEGYETYLHTTRRSRLFEDALR